MDILVLAEYIRSMPWANSAWPAWIASGLASRGHRVLLACDGLEDDRVLSGGTGNLRVLVRRPRRTLRGAEPLGFARWCRELAASEPDQRTISFTRYAPADLWIPLGMGIVPTMVHAVRSHRPASAVMEVVHRPWAIQAWFAERRALELAERQGSRMGHFGDPPAGTNGIGLVFASALSPMDAEHTAEARRRIRQLLDIPDDAPVFVTSAVHADRPGLVNMLAGAARCRRSRTDDPVIVIAGRKTHTIRRACDRAHLGRGARIMGGTRRMDALLAASDAAIVYGTAGEAGRAGRFISDALRMGKPVVVQAGAIGAELVRGDATGETSAGLIVSDSSTAGWAAGIATASSAAWRAIAAARAQRIGAALGMDAMIGRIESALAESEKPRAR